MMYILESSSSYRQNRWIDISPYYTYSTQMVVFRFLPSERASSTAETKFFHAEILRKAATVTGMSDKRALSWKIRWTTDAKWDTMFSSCC